MSPTLRPTLSPPEGLHPTSLLSFVSSHFCMTGNGALGENYNPKAAPYKACKEAVHLLHRIKYWAFVAPEQQAPRHPTSEHPQATKQGQSTKPWLQQAG